MSGFLDYENSIVHGMSSISLSPTSRSIPYDDGSINYSNSNKSGNSRNDSVPPSGRIQRAASCGDADGRKRVGSSPNRFNGGTQSGFNSRNPIRVKKGASTSTSWSSRDNSNSKGNSSGGSSRVSSLSAAASKVAPVKPRKSLYTTPKRNPEEEELNHEYTRYLGNFILTKLVNRREKKVTNVTSDRSMKYLQPLWIETIPNLQQKIMNQHIIDKARDVVAYIKEENGLDEIISGFETRLEEEGEIISAVQDEHNVLPLRKLRIRTPLVPELLLCLKRFKEFFIDDENNTLRVMAKLITAEREADDADNTLTQLNEDELIPYNNLLKLILSLEVSQDFAQKYGCDVSGTQETPTPPRGFWTSTPRNTFHESGYLQAFPPDFQMDTLTQSYESLGFSFSP